MAWPNNARASNYIVTAVDWNEISTALQTWGGNTDAAGWALNNLGSAAFKGATSGTTTVQAAAIASGTLTLPAATDTLVGKATSDVFTNKTISGASNSLTNIGNSSLTNSAVTVNGSAISLGASGTVTANTPNVLTIGTGLSGTSFNGSAAITIAIDSTVATLTGTQTLTGKTISGASNTLSNIGNAALTNSSVTINGTAVSLGGSITVGGTAYSAQATSFTAAVNTAYWITGNSVTVTLPASPADNDYVEIANGATVTGCVIGRNAKNIMGLAENLTIDQTNFSLRLVYRSATTDWRLV